MKGQQAVNLIEFGDCRDTMRRWAEQGVRAQTCVTSPPYFGLRDYGHPGQLGLEQTLDEYVTAMVEVFRCVRDVLADDGTLWLNLGDSYAGSWGAQGRPNGSGQMSGRSVTSARQIGAHPRFQSCTGTRGKEAGLKPKDLIGIPWRLAFALQADGWYLRQDIIWSKPNPMPESVRDRCTKAHEYLFLLSKSERYYFDAQAIAEPLAPSSIERLAQPTLAQQVGSARVPGKTNGNMKAVGPRFGGNKYGDGTEQNRTKSGNEWTGNDGGLRNKRSVWTIATRPYKGAHFATYPPALIEPCIAAGSRPGDIVLDPFMGSGTTAEVAILNGRQYLGCELNPEYGVLQMQRIAAATEAYKAMTAQIEMFGHERTAA